MKCIIVALCLLSLAPVQRHGAETLLELSKRGIKHPPALMSPQTRAQADALMRPKVSLLPPPKALTSRVVTHPPPVAITNVTVAWNLEPMPAILQSIQGPAGNVHPVTFLVASTNGWRSQYRVTPDMPYAASNGVVRRMIQNEQFRAGYKFTR